MCPLQVHTIKKWQPSLRDRILDIAKNGKELTPLFVSIKLGIRQSTASMSMLVLHRDRLLDRRLCPCGAGYVYLVRKHG